MKFLLRIFSWILCVGVFFTVASAQARPYFFSCVAQNHGTPSAQYNLTVYKDDGTTLVVMPSLGDFVEDRARKCAHQAYELTRELTQTSTPITRFQARCTTSFNPRTHVTSYLVYLASAGDPIELWYEDNERACNYAVGSLNSVINTLNHGP